MVDAKSVCNRFRLFFDIIGKIAVNIFVKNKKFIKELEKMKKLISLMLAMVLCLTPVLVSCGETKTPTLTPPGPDTDDPGTGGGSRTGIFMQGYGDEEQHKEFNSKNMTSSKNDSLAILTFSADPNTFGWQEAVEPLEWRKDLRPENVSLTAPQKSA